MKAYKMVTDIIVKVTEVLLMALVGGLALLIVLELLNRNILNKSFRASIEVCGIMFMWMAFLGIIYLYDKSRLMRFEILLSRAKGPLAHLFWYINKLFSLLLGVVMVISFKDMYPFVSTRYFSTIPWMPYSFQFFPMALAGGFIALRTVYQLIDYTAALTRRAPSEEERGGEAC